MKKKIAQILLSSAVVALVGCDNKTSDSDAAVKPKTTEQTPAYSVSALTRSAWLREQLPENAFFYARVPSLWDLASFKEDSFKYAHGNEAYLSEIKKIQKASREWFKQGDPEVATLLTLLGSQMDGPVEAVAYSIENQPQLLLSSHVRFKDESELQKLIDLLKDKRVILDEIAPLAEGAGVLQTKTVPLAYRWDKAQGRLNLLLNMQGADITALDTAFTSLKPNAVAPMLASEKVMDDSQRGLYLWFDNQTAAPVYQPLLPRDAKAMAAMGANQIQGFAASWGVSNGKGRLKVQLDAPSTSVARQFLPVSQNSYPIKTAGAPYMALSLSLPAYEEFKRLELLAGGLSKKEYREGKAKLSELLGYPVDDWFKAIGPEVVLISDQVGEYLAIRLRNPEEFNKILTAIKASPTAQYESRTVAGNEIHHLKLPSFTAAARDELAAEPKLSPLAVDMLTKVGTHLYWQQEGDFLIVSDLPQILFDRQANLDEQTLEQWLAKQQRQDFSSSTLAFSGNIRNLPRRIYYYYLNGLQMVGDLTSANQDIMQLPSAAQLHLAQQGTFGVQLDSAKEHVGLELVFESSPADALLAGDGATTIASLGIMAAVALPAYESYKKKAEIADIYVSGSQARQKIERFYTAEGRFPNEEELKGFYDDLSWGYRLDDIYIEPDTGVISLVIGMHSFDYQGEELVLEPNVTSQGISWYCSAEYIDQTLMPKECR